MKPTEKILIVDFGSQYTQLIARRVRELGVYSELLPYDANPQLLRDSAPNGIILSGGPETVTLENSPRIPQVLFDFNVPILGVCYGMQALANQLGGSVVASSEREFGHAQLAVASGSHFLADLTESGELNVWMSHGDKVLELPAGFVGIASSDNTPYAAMADASKNIYGVQFHPEVTHSEKGSEILSRFIHQVCGCSSSWNSEHIIEEKIKSLKAQLGSDRVILGLSGGVDSSVVAALLHRAVGDQLICVFVDNGLLRLGESDQVVETFVDHFGIKVIRAQAQDLFLNRLKGVTDPEQKRKIIGKTFIEVFEQQAAQLEGIKWLAQGTIYPDVIESAGSGTGKAHVIKSHHNVGGLPEHMEMKLVEPLRELFKDEVRKIGLELGLTHQLLYRHPFPGPGLGVRILGEVTKQFADMLRVADDIFMQELHRADWYQKVSQAFVVFLPVKSVGVMGDARRHDYVLALRAVETQDFMTARWAHLPYELLERVSNRIINEVAGVSRVVYDVSSKPPATVEWE